MANFVKFKESIIKNYELIVKRLTHKLKKRNNSSW